MPQFYDRARRRVVYVEQEADAAFWDARWAASLSRESIVGGGQDSLIVPTTNRYLAPPAKILEAGCGTGRYCAALDAAGFRALGLDYAQETLRAVKKLVPELSLVAGDAWRLPLPDGGFDGLWSLGVIEHFWDGYDGLIAEMARVLRPGGYLFLSHPQISPLRRLKAALGRYPAFRGEAAPDGFYQFLLPPEETIAAVRHHGFELVARRSVFGDYGLGEDIAALRPLVRALGGYRGRNPLVRVCRGLFNRVCLTFSGHSVLLVFQRTETETEKG